MLGILYHGTKLEANARNSVLNHSAEEKTTSEFHSVEQKYKQTLGILFRTIPRKRQHSEFRSHAATPTHSRGWGSQWSRIFCKTNLFMPFPSVPSFGTDSSVNFGIPRNEHFLPRNNGSCSESLPRNFFGTKFRCQPLRGGISLGIVPGFVDFLPFF
jgi:hypothetical protein